MDGGKDHYVGETISDDLLSKVDVFSPTFAALDSVVKHDYVTSKVDDQKP